jgi:hypothetical protein
MPTVECPKCAARLKAPAKYKGRKVKCKKCAKSFVLRFDGASKPVTADGSTVFDFDLDSPPSKKKGERQPKRRSEKSGQRLSLTAEPWRAAIYQRVTDERFNGNFAAFARIALDTMAEQLGYPVRPSVKATSADWLSAARLKASGISLAFLRTPLFTTSPQGGTGLGSAHNPRWCSLAIGFRACVGLSYRGCVHANPSRTIEVDEPLAEVEPENLLTAEPISQVKKTLRHTSRNFKKIDDGSAESAE